MIERVQTKFSVGDETVHAVVTVQGVEVWTDAVKPVTLPWADVDALFNLGVALREAASSKPRLRSDVEGDEDDEDDGVDHVEFD